MKRKPKPEPIAPPAPRVVPPLTPAVLDRYGPVDPQPGRYYVSAADGGRVWTLLGPLPRHELALRMVDPVRDMANESSPYSAFYSFGTFRLKDDAEPISPGTANKYFPEAFEEAA